MLIIATNQSDCVVVISNFKFIKRARLYEKPEKMEGWKELWRFEGIEAVQVAAAQALQSSGINVPRGEPPETETVRRTYCRHKRPLSQLVFSSATASTYKPWRLLRCLVGVRLAAYS